MQKVIQKTIIERLQKQILELEGFKLKPAYHQDKIGLEIIEKSFPNHVFPIGAIHEFLCGTAEQMASSVAFISGLLAKLHTPTAIYVWISKQRQLFPAGLKNFGIQPHQIIFINLAQQKDILWATEEALKCKSVSGVMSELHTLTFAQSQRLQLTVEKSKVTSFILRTQTDSVNATSCAARWQINALSSNNPEGLPGVGFPKWQVDLLKIRNGNPNSCTVVWQNGNFNTAKTATHPSISKAVGS